MDVSSDGATWGGFPPFDTLLPEIKQNYTTIKLVKRRPIIAPQSGEPSDAMWFYIDIDNIEWEVKSSIERNPLTGNNWTYKRWKVKPNQESKFYNQASLTAVTNQMFWAKTQSFEERIAELKAVMQALAAQPIEAGSGLVRPRKRKQINFITHARETLTHPRKVIMHPQRTYQDVQNELETQLVSLPNFSARVKIGVNASQNPGKKCLSCKLLNNSGALYCIGCGKELPAANEFLLTTLKPASGLNSQQLDQRIKRIQARNQQKSLRDRKTVEAEITKRQSSCSSSAAPAQPQPQQPTPQQAQARHARQVPVQGKCPNCGKTNPSGTLLANESNTVSHHATLRCTFGWVAREAKGDCRV